MIEPAPASQRIDRWLWCARRFKTRSLAAKFVSEASVRVTRAGETHRVDKPAFQLREGDEVSYLLDEKFIVLMVAGFADRRGAPAVSRTLYQEKATPAAPVCKASG